eukprot:TRINITY_DN61261_c0_g1_i1.p1 TRINITY_DN61261_c0_g1~~TRINITY_DN61261_c0_g1_i1.p1  ORF type:complete len:1079 (-),score=163.74 TRINITY_DN61261_c0_g1_i1:550-3714(-)
MIELKEAQVLNQEHKIEVLMHDLDEAEDEIDKLLVVKKKDEKHVNQLEEEIEDLQHLRMEDATVLRNKVTVIDELTNQLRITQHEVNKKGATLATLSNQVAERDRELRSLRHDGGWDQTADYTAKNQHQTKYINDLEKENQKLVAELDASIRDLKASSELLRDKDASLLQLQRNATEDAKMVDQLHSELNMNLRELDQYTEQMEEMQTLINNREQEIRLRETEISNLQHTVSQLQSETDSTKKLLTDKEFLIDQFSKRERHSVSNVDELQQKILAKDDVIAEQQHAMSQFKAEIAMLSDQLDNSKELAIQSQKDLQRIDLLKQESEAAANDWQQQMEDKNNTITFLKDTIEFLEAHVRNFISDMRERDAELAKKTEIIDQLENTCDIVSSNFLRRDEAVRDLQTEATQNISRIRFLEEEREVLQHQASLNRSATKELRRENEVQAERLRHLESELEELNRKLLVENRLTILRDQHDESANEKKRLAMVTSELKDAQLRADQSARDNLVLQQHVQTLQKELQHKDKTIVKLNGSIESLEQLQLFKDTAAVYDVKQSLAADIAKIDQNQQQTRNVHHQSSSSSASIASHHHHDDQFGIGADSPSSSSGGGGLSSDVIANIRTRLVKTELTIKHVTRKLIDIVNERELVEGSVNANTLPLSELLSLVLLSYETDNTIQKSKLNTATQEVNEVTHASTKIHQLADALSFKTNHTNPLTTSQISTLLDAITDRVVDLISSHKSKDKQIAHMQTRADQLEEDLALATKLQTRGVEARNKWSDQGLPLQQGTTRTQFVDDFWDTFKAAKTLEAVLTSFETKIKRLQQTMDPETHQSISRQVSSLGTQMFGLRQKLSDIVDKYFDDDDKRQVGSSMMLAANNTRGGSAGGVLMQDRVVDGQQPLWGELKLTNNNKASQRTPSDGLSSFDAELRAVAEREKLQNFNRRGGSGARSVSTTSLSIGGGRTSPQQRQAIHIAPPPPASPGSGIIAPEPSLGGSVDDIAVGRTEAWINSAAHPVASVEINDAIKQERQARHFRNQERRARKAVKKGRVPGAIAPVPL